MSRPLTLLVIVTLVARAPAQQPRVPDGTTVLRDLEYIPAGHERHKLDLLVPAGEGPFPVIVWVHGGAWRAGSKGAGPAIGFVDKGYAVASINYRLSQHAIFPAQIEDCKAAIRWLRADATKHKLDPQRFGVWGSSAGGHLVALLGTAGDVKAWDTQGGHGDQTSRVQCVVDWFGPTDFLQMGGTHNGANSPESLLVGGAIQEHPEKVAKANPITYVTPDDPPFLIMHGELDRTVPPNQSELLTAALKKAGVAVEHRVIAGAGHGGPAFNTPDNAQVVAQFLERHLKTTADTRKDADPLPQASGYRGIWYMNQPSGDQYQYKYSGGMATYPQQHAPIAIYSRQAHKTFFCYGGTVEGKQELLHMISYFDHATGTVPKPRILMNKETEDAHDNPTLCLDDAGHLWIFSSAHGTARPSYIHRSVRPYEIEAFERIQETNFSYTQPWYVPGEGFLFLHTRYAQGRGLFWMTSRDGRQWGQPEPLAKIGMGDYQISWPHGSGKRIATVFDYHPAPGGLNARTNLYYLETRDFGRSWRTITGRQVQTPLSERNNPALIRDYESEGLLVYLKDLNFDGENPVTLYLTSKGYASGPQSGPRTWHTARWTGEEWEVRPFTTSDHNYDHGSLAVAGSTWTIVAPTEPGPQPFGTGGEMVLWQSERGVDWIKKKQLTRDSMRNHTYARRPLNAHSDFAWFWADGDAFKPSESRLYFSSSHVSGEQVWRLPARMDDDFAKPESWILNDSMHAEVISIGDELTTGQRLDTNSQWLSERLCELGVRVMYHTTVADDLEANVRVFRAAAERADVVIATGGLGPTADDLTREAVAQVLGVPLELDEASLQHIKGLFARRTRPMPERNVVQAMFPVGTRPIFNPQGTAPGIEAFVPRTTGPGAGHVFCLPGVPAEMFQMWQASVAPALMRLGAGARMLVHHRIKCFGVGESDLEQMLPDLIRRGREPQVGITVSGATITLRITAAGANADECRQAMQSTIDTVHQCLGTIVFGAEEDELEHAIARLLRERDQTLATVEWGTGGLIAHWFGELAEPCPHYLGGLTIGDASSLLRTTDIPADLLTQHGPNSSELVAALAERCRLRYGADFALAVGPFPAFDPQATTPGQVHFAVASARGAFTAHSPFAGHPSILKIRAAKQALNLLRLKLLHQGT